MAEAGPELEGPEGEVHPSPAPADDSAALETAFRAAQLQWWNLPCKCPPEGDKVECQRRSGTFCCPKQLSDVRRQREAFRSRFKKLGLPLPASFHDYLINVLALQYGCICGGSERDFRCKRKPCLTIVSTVNQNPYIAEEAISALMKPGSARSAFVFV